jgi:hypothetical protein
MRPYYFTVLVLGLAMAFGILYLVRRDHLYIRQGLFWIAVALVSLMFGSWPVLIDAIGGLLGIAYPPTLLLLVALIVLTLKALLGDIAITKLHRDLRRLNQRIALIETEESRLEEVVPPPAGDTLAPPETVSRLKQLP